MAPGFLECFGESLRNIRGDRLPVVSLRQLLIGVTDPEDREPP